MSSSKGSKKRKEWDKNMADPEIRRLQSMPIYDKPGDRKPLWPIPVVTRLELAVGMDFVKGRRFKVWE